MIRKIALFTAILLSASFTPIARSAPSLPSLAEAAGRYAITGTSIIGFTVEQVGGGGIKGRFGELSGTFALKAGNLDRAAVSFDLKPESVTTGQERIDTFLRSAAVFDASRYDTITFRSSHVEQTGPDSARMTGILTAKGRSGPESFDVKLTSWNGRTIGFQVKGEIYRSRYGMDVGTPIYSNVVRFEMVIEGKRS